MNPETVKLLGLADGASQEEFKKAVATLVAAKAEAEKLAATVPDAKELVRQEMAAERESLRAEIRTEMAAERAKVDRAARVASLVEKPASEGKVVADNREAIDQRAQAYRSEMLKAGTPVDYMIAVTHVTARKVA